MAKKIKKSAARATAATINEEARHDGAPEQKTEGVPANGEDFHAEAEAPVEKTASVGGSDDANAEPTKAVEAKTSRTGVLKIVVYAIAKDEAKFVDRWMDSMREADGVAVVDTGSSDDTAEKLRARGAVVVREETNPWRFDVARNRSIDHALAAFPDADVLVCTDLDEVLVAGWRAKLEAAWTAWTRENGHAPTTGEYEYVWNFNHDGTDGTKFMYHKVHAARCGARWTHPVHEILDYGPAKQEIVRVPGMRLEHHADHAKSRAQYLDLLKASVEECPQDDRNAHYYGRELMFRGRWREAIEALEKHLAMPTATWRAERAASMRFIANCHVKLGDRKTAYAWWKAAMAEAPNQREAAVELQWAAYTNTSPNGRPLPDWQTVVEAGAFAVAVTTRDMNYTTKAEAWGARPWDLLALGLWYTGRKAEAREAVKEAMKLAPGDERIKSNARLMGVEPGDDADGGAKA